MDREDQNKLLECVEKIILKYQKQIIDLEQQNRELLNRVEALESFYNNPQETGSKAVEDTTSRADNLNPGDETRDGKLRKLNFGLLTQETIVSADEKDSLEDDGHERTIRELSSPMKPASLGDFAFESPAYEEDIDEDVNAGEKRKMLGYLLNAKKKGKQNELNENNVDVDNDIKHDFGNSADEQMLLTQISDSQGSSIQGSDILERDLNQETSLKDEKIDLTKHPIYKREWFREDFIKNPKFKTLNTEKSIKLSSLSSIEQQYAKREQEYARKLLMKDFNKMTNSENVGERDKDFRVNDQKLTLTPVQNPSLYFEDMRINAIYKFTINEQNIKDMLNMSPNLVTSKFFKDLGNINCELDDNSDKINDFLLTQDLDSKNARIRKKARILGLKRLFQSCFVVEHNQQVGYYVFKNDDFNSAVRSSKFTIDLSIFE